MPVRTLRGFEALETAEQYGVLLYDLVGKREIEVEEAHQLVQNGRDPSTFVLQRWPDSDEEAEQLVLKEYQRALKERHWSEASVFDLSNAISGGLPIHLEAAELAAERLADRGKLQFVKSSGQYAVYALPRTVRFSDAFLDQLRGEVCDACAALDLEGEFHEACLMNLLDFLREHTFGFDDIEEVPPGPGPGRGGLRRGAGAGAEWLRRTAEAARLRFRGVIRPLSSARSADGTRSGQTPDSLSGRPEAGASGGATAGSTATRGVSGVDAELPKRPGADADVQAQGPGEDSLGRTAVDRAAAPAAGWPEQASAMAGDRPQVTKRELIRYLQNIEILDENGELDRLRQEREELLQRIAQKDQQLDKMQRDRSYLMKQFEEMQHDMDVLVQAMQIAKRREQRPAPVVEASFDETDG